MNPSQQSSESDDARWFSDEVQPHESALRAYLGRSLPSEADVNDVVQNSYARLLRARSKGTIRHVKGLLFAIARNVVRDLLSGNRKAEIIPITENADVPVLDHDEDVVEHVCREEELALLTDAINALPPRCREVVVLRKIKGYSQKQIAELLGIAEHTVESLISKGMRRCADYVRVHSDRPEKNHAVQR